MTRGTTPTFILKLLEGIDLSSAKNVYVTFRQGSNRLTKTGDALVVDGNTVDVFLSQEETLSFHTDTVELQLNWTYEDGKRACTNIVSVSVYKNLIPEVLT